MSRLTTGSAQVRKANPGFRGLIKLTYKIVHPTFIDELQTTENAGAIENAFPLFSPEGNRLWRRALPESMSLFGAVLVTLHAEGFRLGGFPVDAPDVIPVPGPEPSPDPEPEPAGLPPPDPEPGWPVEPPPKPRPVKDGRGLTGN